MVGAQETFNDKKIEKLFDKVVTAVTHEGRRLIGLLVDTGRDTDVEIGGKRVSRSTIKYIN